jgi:NAD(P)-dependent dehydrogenase (short-subunit alcohol dehydrogenase family)
VNRPLRGYGAIITGASQGLGLEIARAYVHAGADVFICARDAAQLAVASDSLRQVASPEQRVGARASDVADPAAVEILVREAAAEFADLSILVNNAGIYGPKGSLAEVEWTAWVDAIQINLLGSALAARAMLPHFRRAGRGKIIQLSGGGATAPLVGLSAYSASKTAVVRLAETLALELRADRVDVNSLAPGALNTRMLDEILAAGPHLVGEEFYARALEQQRSGGSSLERAAELAVWLASPDSDGITGRLVSAQWDDWGSAEFARRCALDHDYATLRRIDQMKFGRVDVPAS